MTMPSIDKYAARATAEMLLVIVMVIIRSVQVAAAAFPQMADAFLNLGKVKLNKTLGMQGPARILYTTAKRTCPNLTTSVE